MFKFNWIKFIFDLLLRTLSLHLGFQISNVYQIKVDYWIKIN